MARRIAGSFDPVMSPVQIGLVGSDDRARLRVVGKSRVHRRPLRGLKDAKRTQEHRNWDAAGAQLESTDKRPLQSLISIQPADTALTLIGLARWPRPGGSWIVWRLPGPDDKAS